MSEQDSTTPDFVAELAQAGEIRLEQLRTAQAAKPAGEPAPTTEPDKVEADSDALSAGDVTAVEDKGEQPTPPAVQTPDVSWLPEKIRSRAAEIPSEILTEIRDGYLRQTDYTRKTQAVAEERKSLEPIKTKADLWARLEANPAAAKAAQAVLEGKVESKPAERDEDVDILSLTGPELKAWIRSEADRVAAQRSEEAAKKAAEATFHERLDKPKETLAQITSVLDGWASENALTLEAAQAAIRAGADASRRLGIVWTPENAMELASIGLSMTKAAEVKQPAARDDAGKFAKVASPVGRSNVSVSTPVLPLAVREGRSPKNDRERLEMAAHVAKTRLGLNVTAEDLDALFQK